MTTSTPEPDFLSLAVELICFVQHGRWYNGKVDMKLAEQVAERMMWGPGTAWWPSDRALCREWIMERKKRAAVAPPTLPRPLQAPTLPRPLSTPELPRVSPLPTLPRPLPTGLPPLPRR